MRKNVKLKARQLMNGWAVWKKPADGTIDASVR